MKFNPLLYMLSAMSVLHILLFSVLPIVLRFAALNLLNMSLSCRNYSCLMKVVIG